MLFLARPSAGRSGCLLICLVLFTGCASPPADRTPQRDVDVSRIGDAVPREEPLSKYGNPESYVVLGQRYYTLKSSVGFWERGIASWYGPDFHGKRTSSGEMYDMYYMTAAHKTLPLPTYVEVTNLANGRRIVVKVNDRGPFHSNRVIDLSYVAAKKLGIMAEGTGVVEVRAITAKGPTLRRQEIRVASIRERPLNFFLQIGAFEDRGNADRLRSRLNGVLRETVAIERKMEAAKVLYRVKVGPISSVDVADKIVDKLLSIGLSKPYVVLN